MEDSIMHGRDGEGRKEVRKEGQKVYLSVSPGRRMSEQSRAVARVRLKDRIGQDRTRRGPKSGDEKITTRRHGPACQRALCGCYSRRAAFALVSGLATYGGPGYWSDQIEQLCRQDQAKREISWQCKAHSAVWIRGERIMWAKQRLMLSSFPQIPHHPPLPFCLLSFASPTSGLRLHSLPRSTHGRHPTIHDLRSDMVQHSLCKTAMSRRLLTDGWWMSRWAMRAREFERM